MNINIINISDFPAIISKYEENNGLNYLKKQGFNINNYDFLIEKNNIENLNQLLLNDNTEIVLFSSGGFNSINNIRKISNNIGKGTKILIGFSDTLHIQGKFHNVENIYCIYGITLRNIFELNSIEENVFLSFIKKQEYNTALKVYKNDDEIISGRIYGGHLMIFINLLSIYNISNLEGNILFLEFHGMEDYFIFYYLDFLKLNNIFSKVSGVILDEGREDIINYLIRNNVKNIFSFGDVKFIPFYKEVIISKGDLVMQK